MKKTYIAPEVEVVKVGAVNILASSPGFSDEGSVDDGEELGREDNHTPSRPNLWDQGW